MPTEAIVLAGGLGTRMRGVLEELPKSMAPVEDRPFLEYLFEYLQVSGVERVVLSVGYRAEVIQSHFGARHGPLDLVYSEEQTPLGTGGALRLALRQIKGDEAFLLNGDTLFLVDLKALALLRRRYDSPIALSLKHMRDFDRYGTVEVDGDRVIGFHEKRPMQEGLVNGGVYAISRSLEEAFPARDAFSLERDLLEPHAGDLGVTGLQSDEFFLDLGTPEDYRLAGGSLRRALQDFAG